MTCFLFLRFNRYALFFLPLMSRIRPSINHIDAGRNRKVKKCVFERDFAVDVGKPETRGVSQWIGDRGLDDVEGLCRDFEV